jgi:hypothetical protein
MHARAREETMPEMYDLASQGPSNFGATTIPGTSPASRSATRKSSSTGWVSEMTWLMRWTSHSDLR